MITYILLLTAKKKDKILVFECETQIDVYERTHYSEKIHTIKALLIKKAEEFMENIKDQKYKEYKLLKSSCRAVVFPSFSFDPIFMPIKEDGISDVDNSIYFTFIPASDPVRGLK